MVTTRTTITTVLLLLLSILILPAAATSVYAEHVSPDTPGLSNNTELLLPPHTTWSDHLTVENHGEPPPFKCDNQYDFMGGRTPEAIHLATYTDKANNTIDVWCKWSDFLGPPDHGARQFIAYYNDITVVGQCPFYYGINYWNIMTDEHGIINATQWISVTPDLQKSVMFNVTYNDYNQSEIAHRTGIDPDTVGFVWNPAPIEFFWDFGAVPYSRSSDSSSN